MNDQRIGKGRLNFSNGAEYLGQFIGDQADGHGLYTDEDGNRYESLTTNSKSESGYFLNARLYGKGEIKFKNGDNYIGMFKDGRRSGYGIMEYQNLKNCFEELDMGSYEGEWKAGKRHGKGLMKWADGSEFDGLWNTDQRVQGKMAMSDGTEYSGKFKDESFHGQGILHFSDGKVFEGNFLNGQCMNKGKLTLESGDIYTGELDNFNIQGTGRMIYKASGDVYEG